MGKILPNIAPATPDEIKQIKKAFKSLGYGEITTQTAADQHQMVIYIRRARNNVKKRNI